jgi:zinc/manganese transport system ATP-binding protein
MTKAKDPGTAVAATGAPPGTALAATGAPPGAAVAATGAPPGTAVAAAGAPQDPSAPPAVEIERAAVQLGGRQILREVSLSIAAGDFIAVLGPNGAGKSTLMRTILGLIPISEGRVRVLGQTPQQARSRVGYLPQRRSFDEATRVRGVDLVQLGLDGARWGIPLAVTRRARQRRASERHRVREVIELVGAGDYATRAIGELSGGEQQRLLIAAALVRRPELLILDEPLDSLDLPNQAAVAGLVRRIASAENVAVLLVAHDVNPLLPHINRVVYLGRGRALAGPVDQVITSTQLSELYQAPVEVLRTTDGRLVVVGQPEAPHHHGDRHRGRSVTGG